jgi:putative proteasome-type protease
MRGWAAFQNMPGQGRAVESLPAAAARSSDGYDMTYCVGLLLKDGLVIVGDTRTNAGVDNIATFRKLQVFEKPGERVIALATAGNLAVTQAVISHVLEGLPGEDGELETIETVPTMFEMAQFVGRAVRHVAERDGAALKADGGQFDCSILVAGQIGARRLRLFMVYRAGNFLEATEDTPYLQIGEHKYGKPILDRSVTFTTPLEEALKIALISMDSTIRSNLAVGLPVDAVVLPRDALRTSVKVRIDHDDPYFAMVRNRWSNALREAHQSIPNPPYAELEAERAALSRILA